MFSSRKLERASYGSVAFRFIAANDHHDHDTIATFRRRFLGQIEALFVQVLVLAREADMLKLGMVALDGTRVHAGASRHSALSYEYACKLEAQLKAEVEELMALAEAADVADVPDGMSVPEELARRAVRLQRIAEAKAVIEARAEERHEREQAAYRAKIRTREGKAKGTGRKPESCKDRFVEAPPAPEDPTPLRAMVHRVATSEGQQTYSLRKHTPEPVFGISVMGFRQFHLRGLDKVKGEWNLATLPGT